MGVGREVSMSLDGLRDKNVMQLKKLNTALSPVRSDDMYYADALSSGDFTKLGSKDGGAVRFHIMTLGVLAPYCGLGIGTKLLNHVLDLCSKQNISEIYLHVQKNDEDAVKFYKKFGFEIMDTIQNYYTDITPPTAILLRSSSRKQRNEVLEVLPFDKIFAVILLHSILDLAPWLMPKCSAGDLPYWTKVEAWGGSWAEAPWFQQGQYVSESCSRSHNWLVE